MRPLLLFVVSCLVPSLLLAQDSAPSVSFKPERATYKSGEDIKGTVTVTFADGLHGYQNPPSQSYMLPVKVNPGSGTVLKSVSYPKGHMEIAGGEMAAVYSGTVSFPVVIEAPKSTGKVKLNLGFFYQQCDANACYLPNTIDVSAEVTVEAADKPIEQPDENEPTIAERKAPGAASIQVFPPSNEVFVGNVATVTVRVTPRSGLRLFGIDGGPGAIVVEGSDVESFSVNGGTFGSLGDVRGTLFNAPVEAQVRIKPSDREGSRDLALKVTYFQADSKGVFHPQTETVNLAIDVKPLLPDSSDLLGSGSSESPSQGPTETTATDNGGLLGFLNNALEKGNWALIVPAALLVGLALCLTPCVFPMIPVTVTFFSNQGSKTKAGRFSLGLFYALGIAITYGAVGGIAAASKYAVGALFTKPWFVLLLAALLIALALSMFDVYEIRLPGFIQKNLKGRSGPVGALIMGLLMGFAAAPCAGALVGAVAVKVAEIGSVPVGLGMFGLIGLGMGLPFMALATASSGAKALPKSGGWLKTTKAVLGLLVLYFAMTYVFQGLGMKPDEAGTQIAWIFVFVAFAVYLLFLDKSDTTRAVATIKGVTCVALGVLAGMAYSEYGKIKLRESLAGSETSAGSQVTALGINWIAYNDKSFAEAVASGKPIMIDGKADWCVQCREIEHGVFNTPEGLKALGGVYLMSIDWSTGVDPAYIESTKKRFNILGLPHIVFMEPGGKNEFAVKDIKSVDELKGHLRKVGAKL